MKNRKLLYLMIPLTCVVWGAVIFNILHHLKGDNNFPSEDFIPFTSSEKDSIDKPYTIIANYRDPFAPGHYSEDNNGDDDTRKSFAKNVTNQGSDFPVYINWPVVEYFGLIRNNNKNVALVKIENSNFLMLPGEEKQGVKLLIIHSDSIQLTYKNENKTFRKKQR
jgi:hypothetical protein